MDANKYADVEKSGLRFAVGNVQTLARDLHELADLIAANDVAIQSVMSRELVDKEDFPTSVLVLKYSHYRAASAGEKE